MRDFQCVCRRFAHCTRSQVCASGTSSLTISLASAGYADVLLPFPDEFVSPQIHPVVFADVLGVFIVGSAATDGALCVLVINISEGLAFGLRKAVLIHFADGAFVDLAPGLTDVFIPQHTIDFDLLAEEMCIRDRVTYILNKYAKAASVIDPSIPEKIPPHLMRHTKACLLYTSRCV